MPTESNGVFMNEALYANESDSKNTKQMADIPDHFNRLLRWHKQHFVANALFKHGEMFRLIENKQTKMPRGAKQHVTCTRAENVKGRAFKTSNPFTIYFRSTPNPSSPLPPAVCPWERARSPRPLTMPLNIST